MAISLRVRQHVLRRDKFSCQICGRTASDGVKLEVDHRTPVSKGGTDSSENLWTLCDACNRGKGDNWDDTTPHQRTDIDSFAFDDRDIEFVALAILDPDLRGYLAFAFSNFYDLLDMPSFGDSERFCELGNVLFLVVNDCVAQLSSEPDSAYALYKQSQRVAREIEIGRYKKKRMVLQLEIMEHLLRSTKDYVDGKWGVLFSSPEVLPEHIEHWRTFVPTEQGFDSQL
jgi:hypothetical protein